MSYNESPEEYEGYEHPAPIKAVGVCRMSDNPRAVLVLFNRAPTNEELVELHELLR